jgi:hypothetical protein
MLKRRSYLLLSIGLWFNVYAGNYSNVIPTSNKVNWSNVGVNGWQGTVDVNPRIPRYIDMEINFQVLRNSNPGVSDYHIFMDIAFTQAKNYTDAHPGAWVSIYFPSGTYSFDQCIQLGIEQTNLIIRGNGAGITILNFNVSGGSLFSVTGTGQVGSFQNLDAAQGFSKGNKTIKTMNPVDQLTNDGYIELEEDNGPWIGNYDGGSGTPEAGVVGQIIKVQSVNGTLLQLYDELRLDYQASLTPKVIRIAPASNIGFENFTINSLSNVVINPGGICNFAFSYAANCWIWGVESIHTGQAHVSIGQSSYIEVRSCFFHDATDYGSGGHGYGVSIGGHSTNCLIENNIFSHLRHAMIVSHGANGNVYAYNYSRDQHDDGTYYHEGDISIHGHYPFANLFEGNIACYAVADNYWGDNGPYNTFFRNLITVGDFTLEKADYTNVVGCEFSVGPPQGQDCVHKDGDGCPLGREVCDINKNDGSNNVFDVYGAAVLHGDHTGQIIHAYAYFHPIIYNDCVLNDVSCYRAQRPNFFEGTVTWPSVGPPYNYDPNTEVAYATSQYNTAYDRFAYGGRTTVSSPPIIYRITLSLTPGRFPDGGNPGVSSYLVNGSNVGSSWSGPVTSATVITAVPPNNQYPFYYWSDDITANPRTINSSSNISLYAIHKAIHKSNTATAFSNNSQRKLVRTKETPIGWMHQVYESMGRVWLEHSTDNGSTWFIGNNGQPLDNGAGKCPSIDWHSNGNNHAFVVAYQQPYGSTYTIEYATFWNINGSYVYQYPTNAGYPNPGSLYTEPAGGDLYSTTNANPNIAWGAGSGPYAFALSFERKSTAGGRQPGIYWIYGSLNEGGLYPPPGFTGPCYSSPTKINGTSSSSTNATISLNKESADCFDFDIVYQTDPSFNSNIADIQLTCTRNGTNWSPSQGACMIVSSGSGFLNYKPSMVQMPDNTIRVCWIRDMYGSGSGTPYYVNAVYRNLALSPPVFNYLGNMVNSVSLNIKDASSSTYFAYAQNTNNSAWQNFASNGTNTVDLHRSGQHIQLSNGPSSSAMYISTFYTSSLPYYFGHYSLGSLTKSTANENTYGRGIALIGAGFFYSLKSLTVDNNNVQFAEIPERNDTTIRKTGIQYVALDSLNTMLVSEPFTVGAGTSFTFSDDGGFTDSLAAREVLGKKGYISCKLELIDVATGKTVGVIKESRFSSSTSTRGNLYASHLNLKGMRTKNVRVKITVSSNIDSLNGVWVNEYGTITEDALAKLTVNELTLQSQEIIKEYALEQNYPNPFNPTTTIRYQLPKAGRVVLKVYDMLGREVTTLMDEMKETGYYSATFDGASLASGVYIMRLAATPEDGSKPFVQAKKLMLLK